MPNPVDMATLHLNLSSNSSSQQRLDILLNDTERMPKPTLEQHGDSPVADSASVFSGQLADRVDELNEVMRQYGLRFELSEFDSRVITKVVDKETGDVIRQIPAEEVLRIAEAFSGHFSGDLGRGLVDASA
ncbi:flagellar protein FlaG [Salinicola salarius]|uniref:flagellar protein FlaG n=1 Tax=Salinicola salarius TaxID=430457 RepID=UPI001FC9B921|nr:flagellar protein FlaG [Salinicola salarius]